MAWLGKIIGGTVGFMLGGPLGMIAGAVFGSFFDNAPVQGDSGNEKTRFQNNRFHTSDQRSGWGSGPFGAGTGGPFQSQVNAREQAQMIFFVGAFSMLARIASADGSISTEERKKVEEFIRKDLRLDPQSSAVAMQVFETAQTSGGTFIQFATQFYESFRTNRQMLELMIDVFARVSYADGKVTRAEEELILQAGRVFQFTDDQVRTIMSKYGTGSTHGGASKSYAVLGLKPDATNEEIKRAYRKLVSEYHPDKISSKGLPEEFVTFASDKFREIQAAYDDLRSTRKL